MATVHQFSRGEDGQDLVEYTLLLVLIALASVLILQRVGSSAEPIWAGGSSMLESAASQTS
jgi:Flp pilus assembly pilin Flp